MRFIISIPTFFLYLDAAKIWFELGILIELSAIYNLIHVLDLKHLWLPACRYWIYTRSYAYSFYNWISIPTLTLARIFIFWFWHEIPTFTFIAFGCVIWHMSRSEPYGYFFIPSICNDGERVVPLFSYLIKNLLCIYVDMGKTVIIHTCWKNAFYFIYYKY